MPETFTLDCDNGQTYEIVVAPGNGEWTPGIILNGRGVVVPVGFENLRGEATYPDGTTETFSAPDELKPYARRHAVVRCDFTESFVDPDGTTGFFAGTVLVKVAGPPHR